MPVRPLVAGIVLLLSVAASSRLVMAISFGQFDTFQDGSTLNWREGLFNPSPNEPTNVPDGGPAGAGDAYLEDISSGGFGAGSKMIMFNQNQWIGNYTAAGVDRITAQMANFGPSALHMRIAIRGGPSQSIYGSTIATQLPADGVWRPVTFDLIPSTLTSISGPDSLAQVLGSVIEVRILSAMFAATAQGDAINGTLGVDNMIARDIANFVFRMTQMGIVSGAPRVTFTTIANRTYRVERKSALTDANWTPVTNATSVAGTGSEVQISDTEPGAGSLSRRFYRAVLLPP